MGNKCESSLLFVGYCVLDFHKYSLSLSDKMGSEAVGGLSGTRDLGPGVQGRIFYV